MENLQVGIRYRQLSVASRECRLQSSPCQCQHIILGLRGVRKPHSLLNSIPWNHLPKPQVPQQLSWSPVNWSCAVDPTAVTFLSSAVPFFSPHFPGSTDSPQLGKGPGKLPETGTPALQDQRPVGGPLTEAETFRPVTSEGVLVPLSETDRAGFPDLTPAEWEPKRLPSENREGTPGLRRGRRTGEFPWGVSLSFLQSSSPQPQRFSVGLL